MTKYNFESNRQNPVHVNPQIKILRSILFLAGHLMLTSVASASLQDLALDAYSRGEFIEATELFLQSATEDPFNFELLYNGACAASRAGSLETAAGFLERAIRAGFSNLEILKHDPDLAALRKDPRWRALFASASESAELGTRLWSGRSLAKKSLTLSEDERIAGLSLLWSEAKFNFINFDLTQRLNWDEVYLNFLPKVRLADSIEDYYRLLMEFAAVLRDGHTRVLPPSPLHDHFFGFPLLTTRWIENRVVIDSVLDTTLHRTGFVRGMEILSLDGLNIKQYAKEVIAPWQSASTDHGLSQEIFQQNLLAGPVGSLVRLGVRGQNGHKEVLSARRISWRQLQSRSPSQPVYSKAWLPEGVLHLELNSFQSPEAYDAFVRDIDEVLTARALVLDVRNNRGGNSLWGWKILEWLTDSAFETSFVETRSYLPKQRTNGHQGVALHRPLESNIRHNRNGSAYRGPVVLLVGPRTYSAAEDFAVSFDVMKRGTIIGQPTAGSTGESIQIALPGGGSALICIRRDRYPDGSEFVGKGVQPQVMVSPSISDFLAGHDAALDKAFHLLQIEINREVEP